METVPARWTINLPSLHLLTAKPSLRYTLSEEDDDMAEKVKLTLRVPPELHDAIEDARWKARMTQNEFLTRLISDALAQPRPERRRGGGKKTSEDAAEPT